MKPISYHIHGRFQDDTLTLINATPTEKTAVSLHLLFPFITRGDEVHIFPVSVLDDWGTEIKGMKLYDWVRENGEQFPRAELFGMDENGRSTQEFLRGLELYFRFPCYLHNKDNPSFVGNIPIKTIILPATIQRKLLPHPLRRANVTWQSTEM
jgi:hypothetical protein